MFLSAWFLKHQGTIHLKIGINDERGFQNVLSACTFHRDKILVLAMQTFFVPWDDCVTGVGPKNSLRKYFP